MVETETSAQLEMRTVGPGLEDSLWAFFGHLCDIGEDKRFHPHPFTRDLAIERCSYRGRDVYCAAMAGGKVLGYGMLRGWDAGYDVPSLGIAIHSDARGIGLGRAMMLLLHAEARRRGSSRIRLKVYPDNRVAVELYRSLGYVFASDLEQGQLLGVKTLR